MACWIIDKNDVLSLIILKYVLKANKIGTSLLKSIKLLIVLKNIWNAKWLDAKNFNINNWVNLLQRSMILLYYIYKLICFY